MQGTPCDLVTGEERKFADGKNETSKHVSCTVEMANVNTPCMSLKILYKFEKLILELNDDIFLLR